ncbi:probable NADH dehydrogenase [ubiquinone] 1 alpha subcomplex subunit 12 [Palaemon carinicauda]|uniref:probable NADH dehydrogenase [ubiquinone] 1 alpha subcomplex subunit 12 n=1 Tax=Palaemon carinicauda TaxID=392227 RepID=UPI0035B58BE8
MLGRNRWVIYHPKYGVDYDASAVPAEWFGWLHHKTDQPPTKVPVKRYPWVIPHQDNVTGTSDAYTPYTTTKPKIEAWVPRKH